MKIICDWQIFQVIAGTRTTKLGPGAPGEDTRLAPGQQGLELEKPSSRPALPST